MVMCTGWCTPALLVSWKTKQVVSVHIRTMIIIVCFIISFLKEVLIPFSIHFIFSTHCQTSIVPMQENYYIHLVKYCLWMFLFYANFLLQIWHFSIMTSIRHTDWSDTMVVSINYGIMKKSWAVTAKVATWFSDYNDKVI